MRIWMVLCLWVASTSWAAEGLIVIDSQNPLPTTVKQLRSLIQKSGFELLASIDHSQAAQNADIEILPIHLLIFGKPKAGALLMQHNPTIGIDLPMKYLIWKDASGQVKIAWNDPIWLAKRHGLPQDTPLLQKMRQTLREVAGHASR